MILGNVRFAMGGNIADSQNDVVEHRSPAQITNFNEITRFETRNLFTMRI
jgi:hypothetical protein